MRRVSLWYRPVQPTLCTPVCLGIDLIWEARENTRMAVGGINIGPVLEKRAKKISQPRRIKGHERRLIKCQCVHCASAMKEVRRKGAARCWPAQKRWRFAPTPATYAARRLHKKYANWATCKQDLPLSHGQPWGDTQGLLQPHCAISLTLEMVELRLEVEQHGL